MIRELFEVHVLKRHRLEHVTLLPLGSTFADAVRLYGEPLGSAPSEHAPAIMEHRFRASRWHEIVLDEFEETVQCVVYWSAKSDPTRDLRHILEGYRGVSGWNTMEKGYWYQRDDGTVRLWCSAVPAIGVAYIDYLSTKAALKTANDQKNLDKLKDPAWTPGKVIGELQREFIEGRTDGLNDLARRTDRMAASPDGRSILVVRHHRAIEVGGGFAEFNEPPPAGTSSTQVINCFSRSEGASVWQKIPLPRNADVERLRFEGEICYLRLRHTGTGRVLNLQGTAGAMRGLSIIRFDLNPLTDEGLWKALEERARDEGLMSDAQL